MKKLIYSLLLLPGSAIAQPTIQQMDNYTTGMMMKYKDCDAAGVAPGTGGANQHWMFDNLTANDSITREVISPSSTQFGAQFPSATYAVKSSNGMYDFIEKTATQSKLIGSVDSSSSDGVAYPDPFLRAFRPVTYNNTQTNNYTTASSGGTGAGVVVITADGYGMLHLPGNTYNNVLRVRSEITQYDTLQFGPTTIMLETKALQFRWYDNGHKAPLLVWDSTHLLAPGLDNGFKSVTYLQEEIPATGIRNTANESVIFNASLKGNALILQGAFDNDKEYDVSLSTISGQAVYHHSFRPASGRWRGRIDADMPAGIYIAIIKETNNPRNFGAVKLSTE